MPEHDYQLGYQAAMRRIAGETMRSLNPEPGRRDITALLVERSATVEKLRELCADHGDNDWPEDLYIPDILDKHLAQYLTDQKKETTA